MEIFRIRKHNHRKNYKKRRFTLLSPFFLLYLVFKTIINFKLEKMEEKRISSFEKMMEVVEILNGKKEHKEDSEFQCGDVEKAKSGNKSAIRRVRKAMQIVKDFAKSVRDEAQACK